jgi:hypothetical protein
MRFSLACSLGCNVAVQALELAAKIQRCIDIRNMLLETRRRHKEEQELLQRMQLEQKLKLMQQQVSGGIECWVAAFASLGCEMCARDGGCIVPP